MLGRITVATAAMLAMPGFAPLAEAAGTAMTPQPSQVDMACSRIMGLKPGETFYAACRASLSQSLAQSLAAQAENRALAAAGPVNVNRGTDVSFYEISPTVRWNRERHACAQVGLVPGSDSFQTCVGNLDGAFLPSQN